MTEETKKEGEAKVGKIFLLLICIFFMAAGLFYFIRYSKYLFRRFTCTETVNAVAETPNVTVTPPRGRGNYKSTTYYQPSFSYTYQNGSYKVHYELSDSKNYYPAGTAVTLRIDQDEPTAYYIVDDPILRNNLFECLFGFLVGAVPLALYFLATRTNLLNVEIGKNPFADEKTLRATLEKRRLKMEQRQLKIEQREERRRKQKQGRKIQ